jgi:excisionase family DNA binding protein
MQGKSKYPTSWDDVPLVVDIPYIAVMLGLSNERIRQLLANGTIKGFKIDKIWRVNKADLKVFLGVTD